MFQLLQSVLSGAGSPSGIAICGQQILCQSILNVFGTECRLLEIEFYCHSPVHADPFTHCHELQQKFGYWYLHRVGRGYKNGSFKGLDFTFGQNGSFGGVLIRSIQSADGQVICGPSLCVDYLIETGGFGSVQELDEAICEYRIWDSANSLRLQLAEASQQDVFRTSRVGLSLVAMDRDEAATDYIARRYRFLCAPRSVKKGRVQLILAMHQDNHSVEEIAKQTGSPKSTIQKYVSWFNAANESDHGDLSDAGAKGICAREAVFGKVPNE